MRPGRVSHNGKQFVRNPISKESLLVKDPNCSLQACVGQDPHSHPSTEAVKANYWKPMCSMANPLTPNAVPVGRVSHNGKQFVHDPISNESFLVEDPNSSLPASLGQDAHSQHSMEAAQANYWKPMCSMANPLTPNTVPEGG